MTATFLMHMQLLGVTTNILAKQHILTPEIVIAVRVMMKQQKFQGSKIVTCQCFAVLPLNIITNIFREVRGNGWFCVVCGLSRSRTEFLPNLAHDIPKFLYFST